MPTKLRRVQFSSTACSPHRLDGPGSLILNQKTVVQIRLGRLWNVKAQWWAAGLENRGCFGTGVRLLRVPLGPFGIHAPVAQLAEHPPCKREAVGSRPTGGTTPLKLRLEERRFRTSEAAGSTPVRGFRSRHLRVRMLVFHTGHTGSSPVGSA